MAPDINQELSLRSSPNGEQDTKEVSSSSRSGANFYQASENPVTLVDDCWMILLDYLSIKEILCLEQVCRHWQGVVHQYFKSTGIRLKNETETQHSYIDKDCHRRKCRIMMLKLDSTGFSTALSKWGSYVLELVCNAELTNMRMLWNIGVNCPNLKDATFVKLKWHASSGDGAESFTTLKRVCFENCLILDGCVSEFLKNNIIEELTIRMCDYVTGEFLQTNCEHGRGLTKLKSLVLSDCPQLNYKHFDSLVELTKLELRDLSYGFYKNADLMLPKMTQLEYLTMECNSDWWSDEMFKAITQLNNLKEVVWNDRIVCGKDLELALGDKTGQQLRQLSGQVYAS